MNPQDHSVSGRAYIRKLAKGDAWYAHLRFYPSRRDRRLKLGKAWTKKSAPPLGYLTRRTAQAKLDELLVAERRALGETKPGSQRVSFLTACNEWLRWTEVERGRRGSTLRDYRNAVDRVLVPHFGADTALEQITPTVLEQAKSEWMGRLTPRTTNKYLIMLSGIFNRAKRLGWVDDNPLEKIDRLPQRRSNRFQHLEPHEVEALARAAADEQDAALYITAAFTGLRQGELRQLRWADVAFGNALVHVRHQTKSHLVRSVPMTDRVAQALDGLSRREHFTAPDALVFPNEVGRPFDPSKTTKRFKRALARAGLKEVRFHDLRHTFGTLAVRAPQTTLLDVKTWMGHADIQTTMIYTHYVPQHGAAANLGAAMAADQLETEEVHYGSSKSS